METNIPRFIDMNKLGRIPEGTQLVLSHQRFALIRKPSSEEPKYGNTGFALTEVEDLVTLQEQVMAERRIRSASK